MKPNNPIILHIPAYFVQEFNKYLNENKPIFKYDVVYFYYIVHYLLVQQIRNKNKEENNQFVNINKEFLKSITCSNIIDYVKYLENGDFINSDNHFIICKKAKYYKINPKFLNGVEIVELKTDCKIFKKIIAHQKNKKAHLNRLEPFLKLMLKEFMKIEFDYKKAEEWILNITDPQKRASYMIAINQLKDKRFRYFHRNKTNNRLDTNLTNLKSDLKIFIIGNYVNIDLKNSQPFFLSQMAEGIVQCINDNLLHNINNKKPIIKKPVSNKTSHNKELIPSCPKLFLANLIQVFGIKRIKGVFKIHQNNEKAFLVNLKDYTESVTKGTFYDDFVKSYGNNLARNEVKTIMFKVLFSKNETYIKKQSTIPYKKEKEIFASVYPVLYEVIKMLKSKNNVIFPVFLQKLESYIFIDCIAHKLVEAGIIPLTIHDSIIIKKEHSEKTIEIINEIFLDNFYVIPTLDVKLISNI